MDSATLFRLIGPRQLWDRRSLVSYSSDYTFQRKPTRSFAFVMEL